MRTILYILTALVLVSFCEPNTPERIRSIVDDDIDYLVGFYKHRHMHPEISLEEKQTSKELAEELRHRWLWYCGHT